MNKSFLGLLLWAPLIALAQGHAHEHGVARLDIAVEDKRLTLQLEMPLDTLLGFERVPRNAAEQKAADSVVQRLQAAQLLFKIDPAASCTLSKTQLTSAALKLGKPEPADAHEGHADLDASFEFDCSDATLARYVEVALFDFARLQRLQVQVATPRGQFKRSLKRPERRIEWLK